MVRKMNGTALQYQSATSGETTIIYIIGEDKNSGQGCHETQGPRSTLYILV